MQEIDCDIIDPEVLLINPPSSKGTSGRGDFFTPPMGLAYMASYLEENDIKVDIIDCDPEQIFLDYFSPSSFQKNKLSKKLNQYDSPVVVGIGPLTTPFLKNGLAIAKFLKKHFPTSYLVVGGPHPSIDSPKMAKRMLNDFEYIDAVCINEGEKTLYELVGKLNKGDFIEELEGLVLRSNNGYTYKKRKLFNNQDLDSLPFPSRNILQKYSNRYKLALRRNFVQILSDKGLLKKYGKNPKFTVIFSSRGCPFKCTFCCSLKVRRVRSAENVVKEIEFCLNEYNIHCFVFYDDLFTTSSPVEVKRVITICNLILQNNLDVYWEVELRADIICNLGESVLSLMNKAGCCTVNIGIEKATDAALEWINKGLNVTQIREAINILRKAGDFVINGTFLLGGEFEKKEDILNLIKFSKEIGLDYSAYYPLEIHPGTLVYSKAKDNGLIDDILDPYMLNSNQYPLYLNSDLTEHDLYEFQCTAYKHFYFDPDYIDHLINKVGSVSIIYEQYKHLFQHAFIQKTR